MIDSIIDQYVDEEFLMADGLDEAIIGVDEMSMRLIYSVSKCIEILAKDVIPDRGDIKTYGCVESAKTALATEYFEYNVSGAYVGEKTPIWCHDNF